LPEWFVKRIPKALERAANYSQACLVLARNTGHKINSRTIMKYSRISGKGIC